MIGLSFVGAEIQWWIDTGRRYGETASLLSNALLDGGKRLMIRVELAHTFPVSPGDAFAYITDTKNWKEFFPNFVRLDDAAHAKWDTPGDMVTVVIRFLGREVQVNMKLEEYQKDNRVTYVSRQQGLPDARHERYFKAVPEGFEFCPVVAFTPRSGLAGLFDRLLLKRAIAGALRETIGNLESVFKQQRSRA